MVVVEMVRPVETGRENVAVVDWGVGEVESVAATVNEKEPVLVGRPEMTPPGESRRPGAGSRMRGSKCRERCLLTRTGLYCRRRR